MIPQFKYYFYPFLKNLQEKGSCKLADLSRYIRYDMKVSVKEIQELTKSGKVTKHTSRVNYCASYLKKMELVITSSPGQYTITEKGLMVLEKYGEKLTLNELRELPEFINTQINATNLDMVYVAPHKRGVQQIRGYVCNKKLLKSKNPNISNDIVVSYRKSLKNGSV